ncbi:MAG: dockerin type I repeat-containing protein, partial [candidate division Zixibacteria bacterium]|nr:dockerin type I repeat-containing protein [candidate division Zixibacteria bacterium]
TLPELTDDTLYYWKVKAVDKYGSVTWSTEPYWSFDVYYPELPLAFNLVYPTNNDTIWQTSDTLRWNSTTDPDPGDSILYDLYIDTQPGFASPTIISDLSDTSYYFIGQDDSTYYWKVLAKDINTSGRWSTQTFRFDVYVVQPPDPFTLASPDSASTVSTLTPTLFWNESTDPDPGDQVTYTLYWSFDSLFGTDSATTTDTSYTLPELTDDTLYYWKVKAVDKYGSVTWSTEPYWSFDVYYPELPYAFTLLYPLDDTTLNDSNLDFIWQSTTDPDPGDSIVYDLWYDTHSGFSNPNIISDLSDTSQNVTLKDDSTYYWKVLAKDINTSGTWSTDIFEVRLYVPQPPDAFLLLSPPDDDTLSSLKPTLIWQRATDPDPGDVVTYDLYYDTTDLFTTPVIVADQSDTSYTTPQLEVATFYWWKVKAKDTNTEGTWSSQTFNFFVPSCIPGDANGDTKKEVTDVIYLINYLFKGGPLPQPILSCGDMNCDGEVKVTDVIYLINYLFKGGPPPGC